MILVNAKMDGYGKILESNRNFTKMTGQSLADLKYSSYELILNDLIKQWHNLFVQDFQKSGMRIMQEKKLNAFIKKKNGYIIPVQMTLRNHYSKTY